MTNSRYKNIDFLTNILAIFLWHKCLETLYSFCCCFPLICTSQDRGIVCSENPSKQNAIFDVH